MATENQCPHCGKPVPTTALAGICPECMLKAGAMETGEVGPGGTVVDKPPRQPVPRVDEIAPHFPQLEILECLGRGGMGTVYKARQPKLDRLVALKILTRTRDSSITDTEFTARFQQEARALARLNHPDIVAVYDFGEAGGCHYLLMEYVDGLTLRQLLQTKKLSPEEALAVVPKICEALQFAHERGIVHRDIKPENILLDKQGRVKIADFGIAKILGTEAAGSNLTGAKDRLGTPHYMAPEQVEKPATVDHRADIYSLGVVFYEMLTGELPLGKFQSPSRMVQVDVRLDEVVLHALEKNPDRRYQHASEVKTDVETITTTPGSATVPPAAPAGTPGLSKQEAEKLGRDIGAMLNKQGLRLFARKCLLWFADQALLLFDFTACVPPVVERAGRRCFNFWPFLLLFCSTIGFLVNGGILAILFVQRWWHGHPFDFSIQEVQMFIWMVITGVGRLAALNLGSNDEVAGGRAQPARSITARRVGVVFRRLLKLAALMLVGCLVGSFFGSWMVGLSPTEITSTVRVLWWIPIFVAVGLIMAVGWWMIDLLVRVYPRVWREIKAKTGESANSDGLRAVETWLALLDSGNYAQSWETAAASFQRISSKEKWVGQMGKLRRPLGKVLSRNLGSTEFKAGWTRFGASFVFATSFDGQPAATETVTFARQKPSGEWKAEGYLIGPVGQAEEEPDVRADTMASQAVVNETEWSNPRNWTGPKWLSVYFSKHDSRAWVPKQAPALGWTVNLGSRKGAAWLLGFFFLIIGIVAIALVLVTPTPTGQLPASAPARMATPAVPPVVIATVPESGVADVDPALAEIQVTFSKDMMTDRMWSICQISEDTFPESAGPVHYLDDRRTCVMPVKLQPGKTYVLWFNRAQFDSFRDLNNNPSLPYMLIFQTRK